MEKKVNGEILAASDYFEGVLDAVNLLLQENSGIELNYDDANDTLTIGIDYTITPTWTGEHTFDEGISLNDLDKISLGSQDEYSIKFDPDDGQNGAIIFADEANTDVEMKFKIGGGIEYAFQTIETKLAQGEDIYKFVNGANGDDVRSGFDTSGNFVKSAFDSSTSTTRDIYQIDPSVRQLQILGDLYFPNITGTPTFANHDHSEGGMAQVDHSDLSGIGAEDHHTQIQISDSGSAVLTQPSDMNFGENINITDDGDGTVTIDGEGSTDTRVNVSDDGAQIVAEPTDINFGTNVSVTDDGDGTVTVEAVSGGTDVAVYDDGTEITSATEIIDFQQDFTVTNPATGEAEITLEANSMTIAGNTVSLGESTDIQIQDLSNVEVTGIEFGIAANKPAPGTEGRVWIETDSQKIEYDTGSAWIEVGLSEGEISLANLESNNHSELSSITSDDHHTRPSAGTLLSEDGSNNFNVEESNIDHDSLTNFIANEHIDHSGISITAGAHLTGGGDLTASRTLDVDESSIPAENLDGSSGAQGQFLQTDGTDLFWGDVSTEETITVDGDYTTQGETTVLVDAITPKSNDIENLSQDQTLDMSSNVIEAASYTLSNDGEILLIYDNDPPAEIHQYDLSTPGDFSSASYHGSFEIENGDIDDTPIMGALEMGDGKERVYISTTELGQSIIQLNLSTAGDITSASIANDIGYEGTVRAGIGGLAMKPDGTMMTILDLDTSGDPRLHELSFSTAWELDTATITETITVTSGNATNGLRRGAIGWSSTGDRFVAGWPSGGDLDQYTVDTPYDITANFSYEKSFATQWSDGTHGGFDWTLDGKITGNVINDTTIERYSTGEASNSATITISSSDNTSGKIVRVKEAAQASNVDISVETGDGSTMDGNTTLNLTNAGEAVTLQSGGTNWHILSRFS